MKKLFYVLATIVFFLITAAHSQIKQNIQHSKTNITCKTCHISEVPTKADPGLRACPRFKMIIKYPSPESSPNVVVLKKLENRFGPVVFPHRLHAQMSEISGGCKTCHHYNTLGPILSCKQCHSVKRKREDVSKPDLRGAYHQQCLSCHREWSHKTECVSCHKRKEKKINLKQTIAKYKLKIHPKIKTPTKIVFKTQSNKGKYVTFYHDQHIKKFGFKCINCHKNQTCIRCHDLKNITNKELMYYEHPVEVHFSKEQHHEECFSCHKENKCSFCHKDKVSAPFNHGLITGWPLNKFHKKLACQKCHGNKKQFTKLDKNCNKCHSSWNSKNFDHKITGLILNEDHKDNDCEDCHINRDFSKKPTCDNCHDNKSFPKDKPGKLVK